MSGKRARMKRNEARAAQASLTARARKDRGATAGQSATRVLSIVGSEEERYSQLRAILRPDRRMSLDAITRMMIENEANLNNEDHNHFRLELLLAFSEFIFGPQREAEEIIRNTLRIDVQKYPREERWWTLGYQRKS